MNWNAQDVELYLQERDYIDTAVIPLLPISFQSGIRAAAEQGEYTTLFSMHLERQFKGRMLFFPPFTYVDEPETMIEMLQKWEEKIMESGFLHVFFLTSDGRWTSLQEHLKGSLFYVPSVPLQHMEDKYKHSIMEDQLKKMMPDIVGGWQRSQ
ncbi:YpiF family protein [Bacillus sp. FJAT-50079]|uniref:YpiF family protein n=1 Tax=Bacillus sp. FJAT-50079 TaxID=2833577 RepID=UPI001BC986B4|nr:YpiF family protein [Bacillus sp. FJAT-50079]MBS4209773.1 YpiF family protein [Bacillus sp. FJAT-50079]